MRTGRSLAGAIALLSAAAAPAPAQDTGDAPLPVAPEPATVSGAQSYTPQDFARFAPKTALDMLRQVPGFNIQQPDDRRGLGQASGNVLINGQRPSGKSNDATTELGRISAANVTRIDIVDGATLDVPGLTGQVANVIVTVGGISGSFSYAPRVRLLRLPPRFTEGEASLSGSIGKTGYTISASNNGFRQGNNGPEIVTLPNGAVIDRRAEDFRFIGERPRVSLNLKRTSDGGAIANFNGSARLERFDETERSLRSGPGQPDRDRLSRQQRRERGYEAGGDYEFGLVGGRLKLIGLRQFFHDTFRQTVVTDFADGGTRVGDRFAQTSDSAETIARGEYRWKAGGADWQVALEGALNSLDIANALTSLDAGGAFVPAPGGTAATVKEQRAETIVSYGRPLSPKLSLQLSLGGEYSKLTQSGANGLARSFVRPKGTALLAWKPSPRLDLSLKLERQVGQLDFGDFVSSANLTAGTANAGNPNLVPPQSWRLDLTGTREFGRYGTLTLRGYGRRITDIVDVVPIGVDGQAPGNLDSATEYGIELTSTLNFDPFGLKGAKLDANIQLQHSSLRDPVTLAFRPISGNLLRRVDLAFRHDLPKSDWVYGVGYNEFVESLDFRLDQLSLFRGLPGDLGAFVENKDVFGLTVRGSVNNLLGTNERFTRNFFDIRRDRPLLFTESRRRQFGAILTLTVEGNF